MGSIDQVGRISKNDEDILKDICTVGVFHTSYPDSKVNDVVMRLIKEYVINMSEQICQN